MIFPKKSLTISTHTPFIDRYTDIARSGAIYVCSQHRRESPVRNGKHSPPGEWECVFGIHLGNADEIWKLPATRGEFVWFLQLLETSLCLGTFMWTNRMIQPELHRSNDGVLPRERCERSLAFGIAIYFLRKSIIFYGLFHTLFSFWTDMKDIFRLFY